MGEVAASYDCGNRRCASQPPWRPADASLATDCVSVEVASPGQRGSAQRVWRRLPRATIWAATIGAPGAPTVPPRRKMIAGGAASSAAPPGWRPEQSGVDRMQILEVLLLCFCSDCWFGSLQATYDQSDSLTFRIYGKI
ncbi:hypothetical protein ZWY2020_007087 [Hordeum vulgare]|nr:hypothetical protein ZWY2020_007087 [Hordeum vulgare]